MDAYEFATRFKVTEAARRRIAEGERHRDLGHEVVVVARVNRAGQTGWGVGYMAQADLPSDEISTVSGLRLFVDTHWRTEIAGHQLDVIDDKFVVAPQKE